MPDDRPTSIPLGQLPTRGPLPEDADGWDYARAWADACQEYAEIIRHAQHGAAMPKWVRFVLGANMALTLALLALAVCEHLGACR